MLFQIFMTAYFLFRFGLEFLKPRVEVVAGLGTLQLLCLAGLFYYRHTLYRIFFQPKALTVYG